MLRSQAQTNGAKPSETRSQNKAFHCFSCQGYSVMVTEITVGMVICRCRALALYISHTLYLTQLWSGSAHSCNNSLPILPSLCITFIHCDQKPKSSDVREERFISTPDPRGCVQSVVVGAACSCAAGAGGFTSLAGRCMA